MAGDRPLDQIQHITKRPSFCSYGAPFIAFVKDDKYAIQQACCNHWDCGRCRFILAAQAHKRMVYGAETLAGQGLSLYFWTFTCRGRDLDLETADDHYYEWTNRALSRLRAQARREARPWVYVQVTERQKRGAAHSHFIHTYVPDDAIDAGKRGRNTRKASVSFLRAVVDAGLGPQSDITTVNGPGAVASYISGYLRKHASEDAFPRKWKRVRWSKDWPEIPLEQTDFAIPLMTRKDWSKLDTSGPLWVVDNEDCYHYAKHRMTHLTVNVDKSRNQPYAANSVHATSSTRLQGE